MEPELVAVVARLQRTERGPGTWTPADRLTPFSSLDGRSFPVVLTCLDTRSQPAPSTLSPTVVADIVAPVVDAAG